MTFFETITVQSSAFMRLLCCHLKISIFEIQNGTLQDLIDHVYRTGVPLEEQQILELFVSACRGLQAMHTCKNGSSLAHNDIKVG